MIKIRELFFRNINDFHVLNGFFCKYFSFSFFLIHLCACHLSFDQKSDVAEAKTEERWISLAPSYTHWLYILGLDSHLVARTDFCTQPKQALEKPSVGSLFPPSLEKILSYKPTDVLMIEGHLALKESLRKLGIRIHEYPQNTFEDIFQMIKALGTHFGVSDQSQSLIDQYRLKISEIKAKSEKRNTKSQRKIKVLYEVWTQPLTVAGQSNFFQDSLAVLGLENVIDLKESWPQITLESLFSKEIDLILCSTSAFCKDLRSNQTHPIWLEKRAVKSKNLIEIDQRFNQPSPQLFEDLVWLDHLIDQMKLE